MRTYDHTKKMERQLHFVRDSRFSYKNHIPNYVQWPELCATQLGPCADVIRQRGESRSSEAGSQNSLQMKIQSARTLLLDVLNVQLLSSHFLFRRTHYFLLLCYSIAITFSDVALTIDFHFVVSSFCQLLVSAAAKIY